MYFKVGENDRKKITSYLKVKIFFLGGGEHKIVFDLLVQISNINNSYTIFILELVNLSYTYNIAIRIVS